MSSSDNKKPFPCTGKTPASARDDTKYGFYFFCLKMERLCSDEGAQEKRHLYVSARMWQVWEKGTTRQLPDLQA